MRLLTSPLFLLAFAGLRGVFQLALIILQFADSVMRYELWVIEAMSSVFVGADLQRPIQALPFFEISLPCTKLAPYHRGGMPVGLGIYLDGAVLFTITRRDDGNISLSGAYDGLTRVASTTSPDAIP